MQPVSTSRRAISRLLLASTVGLASLVVSELAQAQYSFSYNFTTGPANQNTSGLYTDAGISPWIFNSEADNGTTAINAQMRYRTDERLPSGTTPDVGVTIRSRVAGPGGGNGTMVYMGNTTTPTSVPFVMDLSAVGSTFTMTMGYAPNPSVTGIHDQPPNVADIGSQLMKMGMVSMPVATGTNRAVTMGINDSLFIDYREITSVATDLGNGVLGSTTGYYEVRTLNSGTSAATGVTQLSSGTVSLQAMNTANDYNYYVYNTTYTNVGYDLGGEAIFHVQMNVQAYSINRSTFAVSTLGGPTSYSVNNVSTDLNSTDLKTMYAALGYRFPDTSLISVTGATYDYFSTSVIPEPAAVSLLGLSLVALLPRRRRRKLAKE